MNPCFAIIEPNTLCSISLKEMLWNLYDHIEIFEYRSIDEFIRDSNRHYIHFFVNEDILFGKIEEFELLKSQTTVLSHGSAGHFAEAGFGVLDVTSPENEIRGSLLDLQFFVDYGNNAYHPVIRPLRNRLSDREKEVLRLMIKGLINKEIAQELEISLATVIFHRNNICKKLQTRSIGKMTIFAVLSGIIEISEI